LTAAAGQLHMSGRNIWKTFIIADLFAVADWRPAQLVFHVKRSPENSRARSGALVPEVLRSSDCASLPVRAGHIPGPNCQPPAERTAPKHRCRGRPGSGGLQGRSSYRADLPRPPERTVPCASRRRCSDVRRRGARQARPGTARVVRRPRNGAPPFRRLFHMKRGLSGRFSRSSGRQPSVLRVPHGRPARPS
jgi:hypothetical protein